MTASKDKLSEYLSWFEQKGIDYIVTDGIPSNTTDLVPTGSVAIDKTNGDLYVNRGTAASPSWQGPGTNKGTAGTGITAVESGDGVNHVTTLTLASFDLGAIAAAAAEATGALIYTFPAGVHLHKVSYMSIGVVGAAGVAADTPDLGVGSVIATGAVATLDGTGTFEDYITGQTMTDMAGTASVVGPIGATAGILTGISLNKAADVKAVHLNIADTWAAASATTLASGTIVLEWTTLA